VRTVAPYTSHTMVLNSVLVILGSQLTAAVQMRNTSWQPVECRLVTRRMVPPKGRLYNRSSLGGAVL